MTAKVDKALDRLIEVLPLKARQESCAAPIKVLHQQVLRGFVEKGCFLTKAEMATQVDDPDAAVAVLKANDMVVFGENGDPIGAYPFTMEKREHRVAINGQAVHAMCALDALSVSPMFALRTLVTSVCRVSGEPVLIEQNGVRIVN